MSEASCVLITDTTTLNGYRSSIARLLQISPAILPSTPCSISRETAGRAGLDIHTGVHMTRATAKWLSEFIAKRQVYFLVLNPNGRDMEGTASKFFQALESISKKVCYLVSEEMPYSMINTFAGCQYHILEYDPSEQRVPMWMYDPSSVPIQQPVFLQYRLDKKIVTHLLMQRSEGHFQPLNGTKNLYISKAMIVAWAAVQAPDNLYYDYA